MNIEILNAINSMDKPSIEALMDLCLRKMNDEDLADVHQLCARRLSAVEAEIARRKQEQPEQEGGFAA